MFDDDNDDDDDDSYNGRQIGNHIWAILYTSGYRQDCRKDNLWYSSYIRRTHAEVN